MPSAHPSKPPSGTPPSIFIAGILCMTAVVIAVLLGPAPTDLRIAMIGVATGPLLAYFAMRKE